MKKLQFTLLILVISASSYAQNRVMTRKDSSLYTSRYKHQIDLGAKQDTANAATYFSGIDFYGLGSISDRLRVRGKADSAATRDSITALRAAIGTGGGSITIDATPTSASTNAVSSGGVFTALAGKASTSSPTITNGNLTGFPTIAIIKTSRVARNDAAYTITGGENLVAFTALTATRAVTLPAASSSPNTHFIIKDESGNAGSFAITIVGTVDGVVNPTAINTAYGRYRFYSSGTAWFTE